MSVSPDQLMSSLARLAEAELDGTARSSNDSWLDQVPGRVAAIRLRRRLRVGATAGGLSLAAGVALFAFLRPPELTYSVLNGAQNAGYVLAQSDTKIRFSDGSEVSLDQGAQAKVANVDSHGARLNLRSGEAHLEVVKARDTTWYVDAGPYTVHVTGTAFDVSWSEKNHVFELALQHGSVVINGPLVGKGVTMKPGQRMIGRADGYVVVEGARPGAAAAAAPTTTASALETNDSAPEVEAALGSTGEVTTPDAPQRTNWGQLVAHGKFREVLADAQRRGVEQVLNGASLAELSALSDAARYARNGELAKRALLSVRGRFPSSRAASDAAFLLGRLAEDSGTGAAAWYDRYLTQSPNGPYASQALGRKMMLSYRDGGAAAAESLAKDYLQRYPNGPYVSAARKIAARQPSP